MTEPMTEPENEKDYDVALRKIETLAKESNASLSAAEGSLRAALPGLPTLPEGREFGRCLTRATRALDELVDAAGELVSALPSYTSFGS